MLFRKRVRNVHFCVEMDKMVSVCLLEGCLRVAIDREQGAGSREQGVISKVSQISEISQISPVVLNKKNNRKDSNSNSSIYNNILLYILYNYKYIMIYNKL